MLSTSHLGSHRTALDAPMTRFYPIPMTMNCLLGYMAFEMQLLIQKGLETTTITIPAVTTSIIPFYNVPINVTSTVIYPDPSIVQPPFIIPDNTTINGTTHPANNRTFTPPPWPGSSVPVTTSASTTASPGASGSTTSTPGETGTQTGGSKSHDTHIPPVTHTKGPPKPTCTHVGGCGTTCEIFCTSCWLFCPDTSSKFASTLHFFSPYDLIV